TFVMVLDGLYISSALNAGPRCRAPTLIYNPPGTTHRDRFEQLSGQFLGIAVSSASLQHAVEYAPLPDRAVSIQSSLSLSTPRRPLDWPAARRAMRPGRRSFPFAGRRTVLGANGLRRHRVASS